MCWIWWVISVIWDFNTFIGELLMTYSDKVFHDSTTLWLKMFIRRFNQAWGFNISLECPFVEGREDINDPWMKKNDPHVEVQLHSPFERLRWTQRASFLFLKLEVHMQTMRILESFCIIFPLIPSLSTEQTSLDLCFFWDGHQAQTIYSRCGCTKLLYSCIVLLLCWSS